jgi:hypothetical protein
MTPEIMRLKQQFDEAMDEYVHAIRDRQLALDEALQTESPEVGRMYQRKCADQQARADAYHDIAAQLHNALRSYRRDHDQL